MVRSYLWGNRQWEVGVFKCFPYSEPLRRIKSKKFLDEIQELPVDIVWRRYNVLSWNKNQYREATWIHRKLQYLKRTSCSHIFLTLPGGLRFRPIKLVSFPKKFGFRSCSSSSETFRHLSHNHLHHGKMLEIVVRLIQGKACIELDKDAT